MGQAAIDTDRDFNLEDQVVNFSRRKDLRTALEAFISDGLTHGKTLEEIKEAAEEIMAKQPISKEEFAEIMSKIPANGATVEGAITALAAPAPTLAPTCQSHEFAQDPELSAEDTEKIKYLLAEAIKCAVIGRNALVVATYQMYQEGHYYAQVRAIMGYGRWTRFLESGNLPMSGRTVRMRIAFHERLRDQFADKREQILALPPTEAQEAVGLRKKPDPKPKKPKSEAETEAQSVPPATDAKAEENLFEQIGKPLAVKAQEEVKQEFYFTIPTDEFAQKHVHDVLDEQMEKLRQTGFIVKFVPAPIPVYTPAKAAEPKPVDPSTEADPKVAADEKAAREEKQAELNRLEFKAAELKRLRDEHDAAQKIRRKAKAQSKKPKSKSKSKSKK